MLCFIGHINKLRSLFYCRLLHPETFRRIILSFTDTIGVAKPCESQSLILNNRLLLCMWKRCLSVTRSMLLFHGF